MAGPPGAGPFDIADRALILDMDGVLCFGRRPAPGLSRFVDAIAGHPAVCLTNNSTVTAIDVSARFARMGVDWSPERVVTVSEVLGDYLEQTCAPDDRAWVLGGAPVHDAVAAAGLTEGEPASVVVVGLDLSARLADLGPAIAALAGGARLVAASKDTVLLTDKGPVPATGSILALLQSCAPDSAGYPLECVGKPAAAMFRRALEVLGVGPGDAVVVGDSLRSDIAGGAAAGIATIHLTCGVDEVVGPDVPQPDLALFDLDALTALLTGAEPCRPPGTP